MSGPNTLTIGIHFDLICPWCYIGKRQLALARDRFAHKHPGVVVEPVWHPVQLLPDVPEQGLPFAEFYERRLGSPEAVRQRRQQIALAARRVGLDLDLTGIERLPNTARAHQLLRRVEALGDAGLYDALLDRLFAAYFQRGEDIGDAATLRVLAEEVGVPSDRIAEATPDDACPLPAETAIAGVPHFVFNGHRSLSGAQDASILLLAMSQAVQAPIGAKRA
ncbi:DsbA family oxidoreductase [Lysobacter niabensis]|uniref:DsbA family oxidoreductase n=1 Tax=Agrilutibacter niabensis TaxID=380628 RepID=UPI0036115DE8